MNTAAHIERYIRWYDEVVIPGYTRQLAKTKHPQKWRHALALSREYRANLDERLEALKNNPQNEGYSAPIMADRLTGHLIPQTPQIDAHALAETGGASMTYTDEELKTRFRCFVSVTDPTFLDGFNGHALVEGIVGALNAGDKDDFRCGLSSLVNCTQRSGNSARRIERGDFMQKFEGIQGSEKAKC